MSDRWRLFRYHTNGVDTDAMRGSLECKGGADTRDTALALLRWWRKKAPTNRALDVPWIYILVKPGVVLPTPQPLGEHCRL